MKMMLALTASSAFILLMTGCPSDNSSPSAAASAQQTSAPATATPLPTTTTTPDSNQANATCTDTYGTVHESGSSWTQSSSSENFYTCPSAGNAPEIVYVGTFLCDNGSVDLVGNAIAPNSGSGTTCAASVPSLSAVVTPNFPVIDTPSNLAIASTNVTSVNYTCTEIDNSAVLASGASGAGTQNISLSANGDFVCKITSLDPTGLDLSVQLTVPVNCGNKIRVGNHCEDFTCKTTIAIAPGPGGVINVPARTGDGTCYAIQLMSSIANSPSSLTSTIDTQVTSRNHDVDAGNPNDVHSPYEMGQALVNFNLGGARVVKISGAADPTTPILVDNFVLRGLYPQGTAVVDSTYYTAYGTSDSTVYATGGVLFEGGVVPLIPFATGGTSTVTPLDLSPLVTPAQTYTLDLRAEDCGGARQLSNIFLIFE